MSGKDDLLERLAAARSCSVPDKAGTDCKKNAAVAFANSGQFSADH
jgi:hypothetical protein